MSPKPAVGHAVEDPTFEARYPLLANWLAQETLGVHYAGKGGAVFFSPRSGIVRAYHSDALVDAERLLADR